MRSTRVVDANVVLRYLLEDHPDQFRQAREFLERVEAGEARAFVPEGVLVECAYVLLKVYGVPRAVIADRLAGVLRFRGVVNENREILLAALQRFSERSVDIVDAVVHETARIRGWEVFSFDRDLEKLGR